MAQKNSFLKKGFENIGDYSNSSSMTITGTSVKTIFLIIITIISSALTWNLLVVGNDYWATRLVMIGAIASLVLALVTTFAPRVSPITSILYAITEGLVVGSISYVADMWYPGVVLPAIMLTMAAGMSVAMIYRSLGGVSMKLRRIIIIATAAIGIVYLITFILSLFGVFVPYIHSGGPIGIGVSLLLVFVASSNLLLDFDFIKNASNYGAPKYMEWYGAFSTLVTLIWMYLEILRLLQKIRDN